LHWQHARQLQPPHQRCRGRRPMSGRAHACRPAEAKVACGRRAQQTRHRSAAQEVAVKRLDRRGKGATPAPACTRKAVRSRRPRSTARRRRAAPGSRAARVWEEASGAATGAGPRGRRSTRAKSEVIAAAAVSASRPSPGAACAPCSSEAAPVQRHSRPVQARLGGGAGATNARQRTEVKTASACLCRAAARVPRVEHLPARSSTVIPRALHNDGKLAS